MRKVEDGTLPEAFSRCFSQWKSGALLRFFSCLEFSHSGASELSWALAISAFTISCTQGAVGSKHTSLPSFRVAMISTFLQWGPLGVSFTSWMDLGRMNAEWVLMHWHRSSFAIFTRVLPCDRAAETRRRARTAPSLPFMVRSVWLVFWAEVLWSCDLSCQRTADVWTGRPTVLLYSSLPVCSALLACRLR